MIETLKTYKITLNEEQARQLHNLLQRAKDMGEMSISCQYSELRELLNELREIYQ